MSEREAELEDEEYDDEGQNRAIFEEFMRKNGLRYEYQDPEHIETEIHLILVERKNRITCDIMSQAEYAEVMQIRATQIEAGSKYFVELNGESSPVEIAASEIRQKKCPLAVRRVYGNKCEIWSVNEFIAIQNR